MIENSHFITTWFNCQYNCLKCVITYQSICFVAIYSNNSNICVHLLKVGDGVLAVVCALCLLNARLINIWKLCISISSSIFILAKYRLKSLDIGQHFSIFTDYQLRKNIRSVSASVTIMSFQMYWYWNCPKKKHNWYWYCLDILDTQDAVCP